jgi:hypothetical protein
MNSPSDNAVQVIGISNNNRLRRPRKTFKTTINECLVGKLRQSHPDIYYEIMSKPTRIKALVSLAPFIELAMRAIWDKHWPDDGNNDTVLSLGPRLVTCTRPQEAKRIIEDTIPAAHAYERLVNGG